MPIADGRRLSLLSSVRDVLKPRRISTSLAASERASSATQLTTWVSVRYASRKATAGDHAARAGDSDCEVGPPVLTPWSSLCQSSRHPQAASLVLGVAVLVVLPVVRWMLHPVALDCAAGARRRRRTLAARPAPRTPGTRDPPRTRATAGPAAGSSTTGAGVAGLRHRPSLVISSKHEALPWPPSASASSSTTSTPHLPSTVSTSDSRPG